MKIEGLRNEADQCIGQLAYAVDERTTVEVQQPEGLPQQLQAAGDRGHAPAFTPPGPPITRPPPASRY